MITTSLGSRYEFCWMDLKTRDLPGTAAFFSAVLGWRFAVDEEDWRRATKIATVDGHRIGGVSDLANSVYPPGTPPHLAHYLAVDDIDRRVETATAHGARLVVPPFDAGDQGRMATLTDPTGAAFSLWQPHRFTGWEFPPHAAGAPYRMLLACEQPDLARHFYREVTGTDFVHADFIEARGPVETAPQWELAVGVDDLDAVAERARGHGRGRFAQSGEGGRSLLRLSSPEELTLLVVGLRNR
ncbi:VOC family protein [Streptomyces capitiformicae]|uniref:Glyoxylase CFP32 n=1 Tax=Streptomyces capitiformicae TaxID=2014920 RepID=A0A918ZSY8_9ACTN|nr:VOC family protein [Streptomyces capitiformicae]GHE68453.1 putative glyoxylase CFP32 [Streptomyces capitiformicae]